MPIRKSDSKPNFAVLLATYNGVFWIEKQLRSIIIQTKVSVTVFVSDDMSNDGTFEQISSLTKDFNNIKILPRIKHGTPALNFHYLLKSCDFSNFDYIAFADQDDIWNCNKLHHAIRTIEQDNLSGYSSDVIAFWDDGRDKLLKKSFPQKKFDYFFEAAGPGCTYVLKQQPAQKFKKFLIKNWEYVNLVELHDWMIYAYFRSQGMKWKIDDKPLMRYRQHDHNQVGLNSGLKAYLIRFNKIKIKWYRNEVQKIIYLLDGSSEQNISLKILFLIKNFWNLRRRPRDAIFLLFMIIFQIF